MKIRCGGCREGEGVFVIVYSLRVVRPSVHPSIQRAAGACACVRNKEKGQRTCPILTTSRRVATRRAGRIDIAYRPPQNESAREG